MSFLCCGVKYSKNDPNTYWCIDTDIIEPALKKYASGAKIKKEIVETLTCKKNGCLKIKISRFGIVKGQNTLLEIQELKGKEALQYLKDTSSVRKRQPLTCPLKKVPVKNKNDFIYGKVINSVTQRARYVNEQGFADNKKIISECRIYKNG